MFNGQGQSKDSKISLKEFPTKLKEVYPEMEELLSRYSDGGKQVGAIKAKLVECIRANDLVKALAIIDYVVHDTEISAKELDLEDVDSQASIAFIAHEQGLGESYEDFINLCGAFHYME